MRRDGVISYESMGFPYGVPFFMSALTPLLQHAWIGVTFNIPWSLLRFNRRAA